MDPETAASASSIRRRPITAGDRGPAATTTSADHPECARKPIAALVIATASAKTDRRLLQTCDRGNRSHWEPPRPSNPLDRSKSPAAVPSLAANPPGPISE